MERLQEMYMKILSRVGALWVLIGVSSAVFGQVTISDFEDGVVESYLDHFSLSRERVYTHFNKSSYIPGDAVWFKCYVFNPKNKLPSIITSNLIVELYNPVGRLVEQKLLFVENGVTDNAFFLDSGCPGGKYTFRAYTNWMKNFDNPADFTSYITVLGTQPVDTLVESIEYDVQLLPESGSLLDGIVNKVAIKAIAPNGNGQQFRGDIIDERDSTIQSFELNSLGMGSVDLNVVSGQTLRCRINLPEGKEATYPVPDILRRGVVAQVSQTRNDVLVKVLSNKQTLSSEHVFFIMIHGNGLVQQLASLSLNPEKTFQVVRFEKSELISGVNCLTVFNENFKPVAERLFYVSNPDIKGTLEIESVAKKDSVLLRVRALDSYESPLVSNLSVSVLPGGTVSGDFTNSLLAEVLLNSGLKGTVENPNYYFEGDDSVRLKALDDLLLSQGWRKYSWPSILDTVPAALRYSNENGFTIRGVVGTWKKQKSSMADPVTLVSSKKEFSGAVTLDSLGNISFAGASNDWNNLQSRDKYQVSLVSLESGIFDIADVDSLGRFLFKNILLPEHANVSLTLVNRKGRDYSKKIYCSVSPEPKVDSTIAKVSDYSFLLRRKNEPLSLSIISDNIMIEEVQVFGQRRRSQTIPSLIFRSMDNKNREMDMKMDSKYKRVEDLLSQEFGVRPYFNNINYDIDNPMRGEKVWHVDMLSGQNSINCKGDALLIVDDVEVDDLNYLFDRMTMSEIEAISVNKTGFGLGSRGVYGAIIVKTRINPLSGGPKSPDKKVTLTLNGFSDPVEYYTPKYKVLPPDPFFTKYAAVYWQPNVLTDERGGAEVKFNAPLGIDSLAVRVEGISKDGQVFLVNKKIKILH
ncbi:MAG: hypothetical protein AB7S48_05340 [Bacteroidales bacterium]